LSVIIEHEVTTEQAELLTGLQNLLDEVADIAHDGYGIDCLLTSEHEEG